MASYRLYWSRKSSGFPAAVALTLAGVPWESRKLDLAQGEHRDPAFLALNPMGQVPALLLPDGTVMTESAAIAWHLADTLPQAGLLPAAASDRARLLRWMVFGAAALYEAELRLYYPERYTADPAGAPAVKAAAQAAYDRHLALVAPLFEPGPFVLGRWLSVLDLYLALFVSWHDDLPGLYAAQPALRRLVQAVADEPRVAPLWRLFELDR